MNFKVRFKNPVFIAQLILAVLGPVLAYMGLTYADMTSWQALGNAMLNAIKNPYIVALIAISVWNALNDPTTSGVTDSKKAMTYETPNKE